MSLITDQVHVYLTIEYILGIFLGVTHCASDLCQYFVLHLGVI